MQIPMWAIFGLRILVLAISGTSLYAAEQTTGSTSIDPRVSELLRKVTDNLKQSESFEFEVEAGMKFSLGGEGEDVKAKYSVKVQRPDKIAVRMREGSLHSAFISNGTTLTVYNPQQNQYIQLPAPDYIDDVVSQGQVDMPTGLASAVWTSDPYKTLMEGVTSATYAGEKLIDNRKVHRLLFHQEQLDWEALTSVDETSPVLLQLRGSIISSGGSEAGDFADFQMDVQSSFRNWNFNPQISENDFKFVPPAGAQDASELIQEQLTSLPHELLGQAAPKIKLPLLEEGELHSEELTSNVLILDFWASWCTPCRRALPALERVTSKFAGQPVKTFAINVGETTETIMKFKKEVNFSLPVALDIEGDIGIALKLEALPTTVLIGMDGRIQVVHAGLSPDFEDLLTSEVEALLKGETLVPPSNTQKTTEVVSGTRLELIWSIEDEWLDVAFDHETSSIYALKAEGKLSKMDLQGKLSSAIDVSTASARFRLAELKDNDEVEFLVFAPWGDRIIAYSHDGKELWQHAGGHGIDDIWPGDLDGDGLDEVAIGYNGGTGLHTFDSSGKPVWKYTNIGNVWHVTIGDYKGDGQPDVISTSAEGRIHVFNNGQRIHNISPGFYADMVRSTNTSTSPVAIIAVGSTHNAIVAACFDALGKKSWQTTIGRKDSHVDSCSVSSDGRYAAIGLRGGMVHVLSINSGEVVGTIGSQGEFPQVSTAAGADGKFMVLVATRDALNLFEVPGEGEGNQQ